MVFKEASGLVVVVVALFTNARRLPAMSRDEIFASLHRNVA